MEVEMPGEYIIVEKDKYQTGASSQQKLTTIKAFGTGSQYICKFLKSYQG